MLVDLRRRRSGPSADGSQPHILRTRSVPTAIALRPHNVIRRALQHELI